MEADYAEMLISQAISLRPGQDLFIRGPAELHDFGLLVGETAYAAGARSVHYRFPDPREVCQLIRLGSFEQITMYHESVREFYNEIIKRGAASLGLVRDFTSPPWFEELREQCPEKYQYFIHGMGKISNILGDHIKHGRVPHATVVVPTKGWAARVFPDDEAPLEALWHIVMQAIDKFELYLSRLRRRAEVLDSLAITEVHVTGGGNDLRLTLREQARWCGSAAETRSGQRFCYNFPSHEVFTVPDCRETSGLLVASMPFRLLDMSLVEDLVLEFVDGRLTAFRSGAGKESFGAWIDTDSGARRLGEIALVGRDAPLYGIDRYFDSPLFDENAASHVALGNGLTFAFRDAPRLSEADLAALGCNRSAIHTDICFGSPAVSITATKSGDGVVPLLVGGEWGPGL